MTKTCLFYCILRAQSRLFLFFFTKDVSSKSTQLSVKHEFLKNYAVNTFLRSGLEFSQVAIGTGSFIRKAKLS